MSAPALAFLFTLLALSLVIAGCGERASTWDSHKGRYVSTQEYKQDIQDRLHDLEKRP